MSNVNRTQNELSGGQGHRSLATEIVRDGGWLDFEHPWVKVVLLMNKLKIKIRGPHERIKVRIKAKS